MLGFTITTRSTRSAPCNARSSSTDAGSGVYVREGESGKRRGSPNTCTWQSHDPGGTSKFTRVDGCDAESNTPVHGRIIEAAPATAVVIKTSRRDNMLILPCAQSKPLPDSSRPSSLYSCKHLIQEYPLATDRPRD